MMKIIITLFIPISILGTCFISVNMSDSVYKITSKKYTVNKVNTAKVAQKNSLVSLNIESNNQISFGDSHVHNTRYPDGLRFFLPLMTDVRRAFPPN